MRPGVSEAKKLGFEAKWLYFTVYHCPDPQDCPHTLTTVLSWIRGVVRRRISGRHQRDVVRFDQFL